MVLKSRETKFTCPVEDNTVSTWELPFPVLMFGAWCMNVFRLCCHSQSSHNVVDIEPGFADTLIGAVTVTYPWNLYFCSSLFISCLEPLDLYLVPPPPPPHKQNCQENTAYMKLWSRTDCEEKQKISIFNGYSVQGQSWLKLWWWWVSYWGMTG